MDALIQALKDEYSSVRLQAAYSLGVLWEKKSETELIERLKHPLSIYRTTAAYALAHKKSISPETRDEIIRLKDTDNRPWVRLGAWKAYELLQEKKEKEQKKVAGDS
jgi:HEAT repeat protein